MFKSTGILKYTDRELEGTKLILEIDPEIIKYYRALSGIKMNTTRYKPHISIIRREYEMDFTYWGKYQDELVEFEYENILRTDGIYYWLDCDSPRFWEIRKEMGLDPYRFYNEFPKNTFHFTVGNLKKGA